MSAPGPQLQRGSGGDILLDFFRRFCVPFFFGGRTRLIENSEKIKTAWPEE